MPDTTTIYITKGAETHGIRQKKALITDGGKGARVVGSDGRHTYPRDPSYWGSDFRVMLAEAIADAEARRTKKLASLKKQIAAMEAIDLTKVREG